MGTTSANLGILVVECEDRPGLVHQVTGVLFAHGANVLSNHEFVDQATSRFFMRTEVAGELPVAEMTDQLRGLLPKDALVSYSRFVPKRIVVLASREYHCLSDILVRHAFGELKANVLAVLANHDTLGSFVDKFDIPFHHVPSRTDRRKHEEELQSLLGQYQPDFLVLAKYMRILSPEFVQKYAGRILNIHHSFLPAFVGADAYRQAFDRGVKVIGATAHYVTAELDAGPIIVQQVISVDHTHTADDLRQAGREVERAVLAAAMRLVFEDRVFLCGHRTVILD